MPLIWVRGNILNFHVAHRKVAPNLPSVLFCLYFGPDQKWSQIKISGSVNPCVRLIYYSKIFLWINIQSNPYMSDMPTPDKPYLFFWELNFLENFNSKIWLETWDYQLLRVKRSRCWWIHILWVKIRREVEKSVGL